MSSHWSLTAWAGAGAGFGPGAGEGLASLPSCHRQAGQEPAPAVLPAAPGPRTCICFKSAANHERLEVVQNKNLFHN